MHKGEFINIVEHEKEKMKIYCDNHTLTKLYFEILDMVKLYDEYSDKNENKVLMRGIKNLCHI